MKFPRASGILLHPTSLPGKFGIGDFGDAAFRFVDFLAQANQTYWQILPLGQTGYGDSPYNCFSAFAGNVNLIAPQKIHEDGFLTDAEIKSPPKFSAKRVDFGKVVEYKKTILEQAFARFRQTDDAQIAKAFHQFCDENNFWLEDYALFQAVRFSNNQKSWQEWDAPLKMGEPEALEKARRDLDDEIFAQKFCQFVFFKQWFELKNYANERGIKIIGDVPIFVALDSSDVWCNQSQFKLNADGSPRVVSGVPPDYFSRTGQRWGNPLYDWERMQANNFDWWRRRVEFSLEMFNVIRLDHFRGFEACWEVPAGDQTAENGHWNAAPGNELFAALENAFGDLPMLAEDLGVITPGVEHLRDSFGFAGMKILLFAFGGGADNPYLPHNFIKNSAVYTGNHDNDTIVGWFKTASERERKFCLEYLASNGKQIHWDFIRAAFASVANTAIVPLQDALGFGNEARMNLPSTDSGNWNWRCGEKDFSDALAERLKTLAETYGRNMKQ